jgi:hypothetical protein
LSHVAEFPKNHPRNPDRRLGPAPSDDDRPDSGAPLAAPSRRSADEVCAELAAEERRRNQPALDRQIAEALADHSIRQRALASELRAKARAIRTKGQALLGRHTGQGNQLDQWRHAQAQGAESEALELERRAARSELRALRADQGKLLCGSEENQDVQYLREQCGYALLRLGCPIVTT